MIASGAPPHEPSKHEGDQKWPPRSTRLTSEENSWRIGTGDSDQGPVRHLHSDWWDILGRMDISLYDFQSTLIDRSFSYVSAGSTVFIIASARLDLDAVDDALCVADFQSGDSQINVPAVFVSTFPPIT